MYNSQVNPYNPEELVGLENSKQLVTATGVKLEYTMVGSKMHIEPAVKSNKLIDKIKSSIAPSKYVRDVEVHQDIISVQLRNTGPKSAKSVLDRLTKAIDRSQRATNLHSRKRHKAKP